MGIVGLARPWTQLAQLERAGRRELLSPGEDLDGTAAADALAAAGLTEREAGVAHGVEQGRAGEGGRVEGLLAAPRAEHDLGHAAMVREKPKGQLREKLALRTVAGTGFEPMTSGL